MDTNDKKPLGPRIFRGKGRRQTDHLLIAALVNGDTYDAACQHARVSMSTLVRRLANPSFISKLAEARRVIVQQVCDKASSYGAAGMDRLLELTQSENPAIALGAARTLVEVFAHMAALAQIDKRLMALEQERTPKKMRYVS